VLIAGGQAADGSGSAEIWNLETNTMTAVAGPALDGPHAATLLADGRVLLQPTGGQGAGPEIFDPATNATTAVNELPSDDGGTLLVTEARPANRAMKVPVDALVTLRLSHAADASTVSDQTIVLTGPRVRFDDEGRGLSPAQRPQGSPAQGCLDSPRQLQHQRHRESPARALASDRAVRERSCGRTVGVGLNAGGSAGRR
jgi:hypothetical protein